MRKLLFVDSRLAWPPVLFCVFVAVSVVVFDFIWRVITMSFESLALLAVLVAVLGTVTIFVAAPIARALRS
jgi:hypothetical protein